MSVSFWRQLPADAQADLSRAGFTQAWFDLQPEPIRLTLLNIYVKLSLLKLWSHVKSGEIPSPGVFNFEAVDVAKLKKELTDRSDFGSPESSSDDWSSSEKTLDAMLHFKHHKSWKQGAAIQAHIDPVGWSGLNPKSWIAHRANYDAYQEPYRIRDVILAKFGSQQKVTEVLLGIGASPNPWWDCGAFNCPTHSKPEHRCSPGTWHCGREQPKCPGHSGSEHRCASGSVWQCGARNCPTHGSPDHRCARGVWRCGKLNPPCPGHASRDHRCQPGAALLWAMR